MSTTDNGNLGRVVTNAQARKAIYGTHVVLLLAAGALAAFFLGMGETLPTWLVGITSALTFLGVPVSALAIANTPQPSV